MMSKQQPMTAMLSVSLRGRSPRDLFTALLCSLFQSRILQPWHIPFMTGVGSKPGLWSCQCNCKMTDRHMHRTTNNTNDNQNIKRLGTTESDNGQMVEPRLLWDIVFGGASLPRARGGEGGSIYLTS
jgi:hypothetical protein